MPSQSDFNNLFAVNRQLQSQLASVIKQLATLDRRVAAAEGSDYNQIHDLNRIPGRRIPFFLGGSQSFTSTQNGTRAAGINMTVSTDGPFIWTHMPVCLWRVELPTNATNFGFWRPCSIWPLPTQTEASDIVNLSWEIQDSGTQRNLQVEKLPPMFSSPYELVPLPHPMHVTTNSILSFIPTYEDIAFDSGGTATTGGKLVVVLPGYRIIGAA